MKLFGTVVTAWRQASARQAPLLAAGVAFYLFLSLFPALIAAVSIYGLVADPDTVATQTRQVSAALPEDAASLINGQLEQLSAAPTTSLGVGALVSIVLAVYAASAGIANLVTAINQLFGIEDDRSFLRRKLLGLALTAGALAFGLMALSLVAAAPAVLDAVDAGEGARIATHAVRWLVLAAGLVLAVGVLYRVAPNRTPTAGVVTTGVLLATAIWLLVSVGFSTYVDTFGGYARTYGALTGVVVLMLWLWIGMYALLLGACLQAAREHIVTAQTLREDVDLARRRGAEAAAD